MNRTENRWKRAGALVVSPALLVLASWSAGCGLILGIDEFTDAPATSGSGGAGSGVCEPGATVECPYAGPPETRDVGACKAGVKTCLEDGSGYGPCSGEVTPAAEDCATPEDEDCDGEANEAASGCVCAPGEVTACYSGPPTTEGVGVCAAGQHTCNPQGTGYGPCGGEVTPSQETCADSADENCDSHDCVQWAALWGGVDSQQANTVAVDAQNNAYVAGDFSGTLTIGASTLIAAGSDVFLAKLDAAGNALWSKQFNTVKFTTIDAVAAEPSGGVFIGGYSEGAINLGGSTLNPGLFVAHFDAAGQHTWSRRLTSTTCPLDAVESIAVTPQGDLVVAGTYCGSMDVGDGPVASQMGSNDAFVLKLRGSDGSGKVADGGWLEAIGNDKNQFATGVAVDAGGNILVTGSFFGAVNFGLGTLTSAGSSDIFLAKLAPDGTAIWNRTFGDADSQRAHALAVDGAGSVIVVASFLGSVNFGGGVVTASGPDANSVVFKYATNNFYEWSKVFGAYVLKQGVAVDPSGNVFIGGDFRGSVDFGAGVLTTAGADFDVFLARLTSDGKASWSRRHGGSDDQNFGGIAVNGLGEPVVAGATWGTVDFGAGDLSPTDARDAFVAKFAP